MLRTGISNALFISLNAIFILVGPTAVRLLSILIEYHNVLLFTLQPLHFDNTAYLVISTANLYFLQNTPAGVINCELIELTSKQ